MGISYLTAAIIKSHKAKDIRCLAGHDKREKKWAGFVYLYEGEEIDRILLSTDARYESEGQAVAEMMLIVKQVRATKL
jgi:hypothetical protein